MSTPKRTPKEDGLDLAGIGKLARCIPAKSWERLTETACKTFESVIAPITATTGGIGRLIAAKFDRLLEAEKVFAAEAIRNATAKANKSGKAPSGRAKANVIIEVLNATATESDEILRDLWENLLAQEILDGQVHPEFPAILRRLSAQDAQMLSEIASTRPSNWVAAISRELVKLVPGGLANVIFEAGKKNFSRDHLRRLGVIEVEGGMFSLSILGQEFIKAVSDPTLA